jgi:hypothetical protein
MGPAVQRGVAERRIPVKNPVVQASHTHELFGAPDDIIQALPECGRGVDEDLNAFG